VRCPFCKDPENKVIDSRESHEGSVIRRRRECLSCKRRFTTYERVEELTPLIVKKDGRREAFDRDKLIAGLMKASEKRPVSVDELETLVSQVEKQLQDSGEKEVPASVVGEAVMKGLKGLDEVAYVRFASVYRSFRDVGEFLNELRELVDAEARPPARQRGASKG
jgi:transcriptional repressor NrdR